MRILVTVASKHGATDAIGQTIAETLRDEGLGLAERAVVGVVKAPYGDFRNWPAVTAWARWIAHELGATAIA